MKSVVGALVSLLVLTACSSAVGGSGRVAPSGADLSTGSTPAGPSTTTTSSVPPSGSSTSASSDPGELSAARAIPGVIYHAELNRMHQSGVIQYDTTPPTGGNHNAYWADCTGTVYPQPIANENAVHMLEHGAVWVTYREGLDADDLSTLTGLVSGTDYSALSPNPGLKSAISLQSWGYQLFVDSASDARVKAFFDLMRQNSQTTPELGASCSNPAFKAHPSTFGHPLDGP